MIDGNTELIAHIGFPTFTFKSPMIYNPYFAAENINARVMPMACEVGHLAPLLKPLFQLKNLRGALITMPHKVAVLDLLDEVSITAQVAGACNAVKALKNEDGSLRLVGDMFDGEGFIRGLDRKGFGVAGKSALVVGAGGVGSAIAASLAKNGIRQLNLYDHNPQALAALSTRLARHYPQVQLTLGNRDPRNQDLVVNASPLGMKEDDPLPIDVQSLSRGTMVGEVVLKSEMTPLLLAASARGCQFQVGTDMLFEQIPVYLEYFGFPSTSAEHLRQVAKL
jgi:shikimate dehydrogenase